MTVHDHSAGLFRRRTPVILQHEHAECGLACIAMVAGFHGRATSLAELRARRQAGDRGLSVDDLVTLADRIGLAARAVRIGKSGFAALRLPAVLHWKSSHFVVLTRLGRRGARIHDPARGPVAMTRNELLAAASGVAIEFVPARDFDGGRRQQSFSLLQFAGSVRHLWRYLGVLVALMATSQVLALAPAIVTQVLIDDIAVAGDRIWIGRMLAGLLIVMLLAVALEAMRGWIGLFTGTRFAVDSTSAVVGHLLKLPDTFVARRHLGDLLSRLESLGPLRRALTEWLVDSLVQVFVIAITLSAMLFYSPLLTLVSVAGLTAALLLIAAVTPPMRRLNEDALVQRAAEKTSLLETLRRFETVRGLGLADQRRRQWQAHFIAGLGRQARQSGIGLARTAASGVINAVEQVVFLYIGLRGVLDNGITLGVLFAFMGFRARLGAAASNLYAKIQRYALIPVHTRRLSDIVMATATPATAPGAVRRRVQGEIAAHGLCFSYERDTPLIDGFACRVAAGSHVAITGPSGCGKTTLLRLLAGIDAPDAGTVMLDGIELCLWCRDHLAEQTAFVFQGDGLFRGTIGENIAAFSTCQDAARIRGAATLAEVWGEILALPMGLDTMLSDTSVALSGGQVQRLALARVLYRQPRVLFLDEATSHLDVATERRVWHNLRRLGVTVLSVAHRPEAIRQADEVIAMA